MLNYKPTLEKVQPEFGSSILLRSFAKTPASEMMRWHYHPEMELIYIENGQGKRHIGNHISNFTKGDLILIGSNVPHYGFESKTKNDETEIVLQFHEQCFGNGFLDMVELSSIKEFFVRMNTGLSFHGNAKEEVGERLKQMFYMNPFEKILELIKILHVLSISDEFVSLNAKSQSLIVSHSEVQRIEVIYDHVRNNFDQSIKLEVIAESISMTVPALCRFFKKSTGKTFVQFLTEYRIAHACNLISKDENNITQIAYDSGFQNLSNFNRAFKKITGKSPSAYKKELQKVFLTPE